MIQGTDQVVSVKILARSANGIRFTAIMSLSIDYLIDHERTLVWFLHSLPKCLRLSNRIEKVEFFAKFVTVLLHETLYRWQVYPQGTLLGFPFLAFDVIGNRVV